MKNVTAQLTKFHYCIAALDENTALHVENLVLNPGNNPFDELCTQLQDAFGLDRYHRAEALAQFPASADDRPSQLLAKLRALLPKEDETQGEGSDSDLHHVYL